MKVRLVRIAAAAVLGGVVAALPLAQAGAQRVPQRDTDSASVARNATRYAARKGAKGDSARAARGEVTSIEYRKAWLRIDSLVAQSAVETPNAGGVVGFTHGVITPGVGMTGSNAGGNNSNGRTATPAQGSAGSPNP